MRSLIEMKYEMSCYKQNDFFLKLIHKLSLLKSKHFLIFFLGLIVEQRAFVGFAVHFGIK